MFHAEHMFSEFLVPIGTLSAEQISSKRLAPNKFRLQLLSESVRNRLFRVVFDYNVSLICFGTFRCCAEILVPSDFLFGTCSAEPILF